MLIRIRVDDLHPPAGQVTGDHAPARPFSGWLGLLAALSQLLERTPLDADQPPQVPLAPLRGAPLDPVPVSRGLGGGDRAPAAEPEVVHDYRAAASAIVDC